MLTRSLILDIVFSWIRKSGIQFLLPQFFCFDHCYPKFPCAFFLIILFRVPIKFMLAELLE